MIQVDMKSLLEKLNSLCLNTLQNAAGLCVSRTHYEVCIEHFILKLLEDPKCDVHLILDHFELDVGRLQAALTHALEDFKTGNSSKPVFSPILMELVQQAWLLSSIDLNEKKIRSGALLLAILSKPRYFANGEHGEMLFGISSDALLKEFFAIVKHSVEHLVPSGKSSAVDMGKSASHGFVERFCVDFTVQARSGGIDPVFGRNEEIRKTIEIFARRRKNNPILVGEPGVGKTAVVEGLALRIVENDVPVVLQGATLLGLDMGALEAGAGMKGEFENRLKGVLNEIKSFETPVILFIDEAHTLIGAGGSAGGSDAANLLKPALARGEIRTAAATTWSEYKKYFEKDPALARRFQLVKLAEPSVETATLILRGLKVNYESSHHVVVRDDAITAATELSHRYISGRFLPDKAIDLLDTGCARIQVNLTAKPPRLDDLERAIQASERHLAALKRDRDNGVLIDEEEYKQVSTDREDTLSQAAEIQARWEIESQAAHLVVDLRQEISGLSVDDQAQSDELKSKLEEASAELEALQGPDPLVQIEVTPDVIAQVVSDWTGVPIGKMLRDQATTIIHLDQRLKERIKGQDQALSIIAEGIRAGKAGIKNPHTPTGVFLLVGPSGVGKTECALSLAEQIFGGERNVVTINMSEFMESHSVSRLIGSPPGYVGYGQGGMLTEAVRQQPYSVVLLDEVEKAHPDVLNLFYQVFDKGTLSDGEGKEIDFKNTVVILTSNLATDVIQEMTAEGAALDPEVLIGAIRPILSKHFKPALLARMTIVPFVNLNSEAMEIIAELKLTKLQQTLLANNKIMFTWDPQVTRQIAARCTEVETGARNVEFILAGKVLPELSKNILSHIADDCMPSAVHLDMTQDGVFNFTFTGMKS
jgi:type VI secretion system protein VasG